MRNRILVGLAFVLVTMTSMSPVAAKPPVPKKQTTSTTKGDAEIDQMAAMSNILSYHTASLSSKLAIAMAGQGSDFVLGNGSGGMGFRGTGTDGGGTDGKGQIHGLGKIDTGNSGIIFTENPRRVARHAKPKMQGFTAPPTQIGVQGKLTLGEPVFKTAPLAEKPPVVKAKPRANKTKKGGLHGKTPCNCPCTGR